MNRLSRVFLAAVVAVSLMLSGCQSMMEVISPQSQVVELCTHVVDRNAGISCINYVYDSLRDTAITVDERYFEGRITSTARDNYKVRLNKAYAKVEAAEKVVLFGDLTTAEGQLDTLIAVLEEIERSAP